MKAYVYKWTNTRNKMWYIGSHKGHRKDYIGSGTHFKAAYNKNPKDFQREIIYLGDYKTALKIEQYLLDYFDAKNDKQSYNLKNRACGGNGGANKGLPSKLKNRKRPIEVNQKISNSLKGKYLKSKNPNSKKVYSESLDLYFDSAIECAEYLNINKYTLYSQIRGNGKNKYKIRYV
jgi:hypothetical protein